MRRPIGVVFVAVFPGGIEEFDKLNWRSSLQAAAVIVLVAAAGMALVDQVAARSTQVQRTR